MGIIRQIPLTMARQKASRALPNIAECNREQPNTDEAIRLCIAEMFLHDVVKVALTRSDVLF